MGYRIQIEVGSEEGVYESSTDVHLYDLMGDSLANLDEPPVRDPADVLVATAAWEVGAAVAPSVEEWLRERRFEPRPWLTPWREGEPTIPADLWLDRSDDLTAVPNYLVARLDNPYFPYMTLRKSIDTAIDRFADLRRSVEENSQRVLAVRLPRATRAWLDRLHADLGEEVEPE